MLSPKISSDTGDKKAYIAKAADSNKKTINQSPAQQLATTNQANNSNPGAVVAKPKQPAKSMADMFAEEQALKTKKPTNQKQLILAYTPVLILIMQGVVITR